MEDGFNLPEAKGGARFIDLDTVFVNTDFGPGSLTESGYPRLGKLWRRGQPLAEATTIYGQARDIGVWASVIHTPERDYPMVVVAPTFFTNDYYLKQGMNCTAWICRTMPNIEAIFKNQLLVSLKSDWKRDGQTCNQGTLVSGRWR